MFRFYAKASPIAEEAIEIAELHKQSPPARTKLIAMGRAHRYGKGASLWEGRIAMGRAHRYGKGASLCAPTCPINVD